MVKCLHDDMKQVNDTSIVTKREATSDLLTLCQKEACLLLDHLECG